MQPVRAQTPLSTLPFCLSFSHFPWLFMDSAITCSNYAWTGPPEAAVGSTLGQLQQAGPPKPMCFRPNLELQSRGNSKCKPLFPHPVFLSSFQEAYILTSSHMGLVIKSLSSFDSKPQRWGLKSSHNSFPTFSVRVKIKEKKMRKDRN